jgi:hypothetical protein
MKPAPPVTSTDLGWNWVIFISKRCFLTVMISIDAPTKLQIVCKTTLTVSISYLRPRAMNLNLWNINWFCNDDPVKVFKADSDIPHVQPPSLPVLTPSSERQSTTSPPFLITIISLLQIFPSLQPDLKVRQMTKYFYLNKSANLSTFPKGELSTQHNSVRYLLLSKKR